MAQEDIFSQLGLNGEFFTSTLHLLHLISPIFIILTCVDPTPQNSWIQIQFAIWIRIRHTGTGKSLRRYLNTPDMVHAGVVDAQHAVPHRDAALPASQTPAWGNNRQMGIRFLGCNGYLAGRISACQNGSISGQI